MGEAEMDQIASLISRALDARDDAAALSRLTGEVAALASRFPLYASRLAHSRA
jgi:glycine/serine hydroxymethyltransferase